ncbi:MAG: flavin oxidoreductase, partial [Eubacterium sp.]|nr:flavin oxidoreductase [Eubacterium sp.]
MRKDLGVKPAVYPMPVLMVATYDENGVVDVMNAAWGMICSSDKITLALTETHKTVKNIKKSKAFTVSLADVKNIKE